MTRAAEVMDDSDHNEVLNDSDESTVCPVCGRRIRSAETLCAQCGCELADKGGSELSVTVSIAVGAFLLLLPILIWLFIAVL